jgi:hypothetical protein
MICEKILLDLFGYFMAFLNGHGAGKHNQAFVLDSSNQSLLLSVTY